LRSKLFGASKSAGQTEVKHRKIQAHLTKNFQNVIQEKSQAFNHTNANTEDSGVIGKSFTNNIED
jgi:hypothetical protein